MKRNLYIVDHEKTKEALLSSLNTLQRHNE